MTLLSHLLLHYHFLFTVLIQNFNGLFVIHIHFLVHCLHLGLYYLNHLLSLLYLLSDSFSLLLKVVKCGVVRGLNLELRSYRY